jgi:hypothetical protein
MMSEVLDDERKEAFLQALHGLKEEQNENAVREKEIQQQQQEQLEQQRQKEEEARLAEARRADEDAARQREEARRQQQRPPDPSARPKSSLGPGTSRSSRAATPKKDITRRPPPASLYKRAANMFAALQTLVLNTAHTLSSNPMAMMRTVLFLLMFALAFGRRDLRERAKRILQRGWEKVRGTVGMGVKVSYI